MTGEIANEKSKKSEKGKSPLIFSVLALPRLA
jgi:hypothetical protein